MNTPSNRTSAHAILVTLASVAMAASAHAAPTASSVVEAPWDVTGTLLWSSDSGQTLTWGAGFDFSQTSVGQSSVSVNGTVMDSDNAFASDWTDTHAESDFAGAAGMAHGDGSATGTQVRGLASATATAAGEVTASGDAARAGRFTVHGGPGMLTFSFPYTYTITVSRDNSDQAVFGYARPSLSLDNYGPDPAHNPRPYVPLTSVYDYGIYHAFGLASGSGPLSAALTDDGLVTVSLFFADGDKGHFGVGFSSEASAYAPTAPVPLPGAAPLLALGVAGLGLVKKRRRG